MTHALLLDVDGVIVTGHPVTGAPWSATLRDDLGLDPALLRARFFDPFWGNIVRGQTPLGPCLEAALEGLDVTAEALMSYWFAQDSRLEMGLLNEVAQLRAEGWAVYLATNQEPRRMQYLLDDLGLAEQTDGAFFSGELGHAKPEPAFYAAIEAKLACDPTGLCLIDDTEANVLAARARGWRALHWTPEAALSGLRAQLPAALPPSTKA